MIKVMRNKYISFISMILAVLMVMPITAAWAESSGGFSANPVVISNLPGEYKISIGKSEDVKIGSKGILSRDGNEIAGFKVTDVDWGYSNIEVFDIKAGESVRVGDDAKITEVSSTKKVKKDNTGKILGAILLVAALLSIDSKHGGSSTNDGGQTVVGGPPATVAVNASISSIQADGNSFAQITATVKDAAGKPVTDGTIVDFAVEADASGGGNCTITQSAATSKGQAIAYLYSRDVIGNISKSGVATVVAKVGVNQPGSIPKPAVQLENRIIKVQVISDLVAVIALSSNSDSIKREEWIKAGNSFEITAVVRDASHNAVADGTAVYFTTNEGMINGAAGNINGIAASTTTNGIAKANLVSDYTQGSPIPSSILVVGRCGNQSGSIVIPITTTGGGGGTVARSLQLTANPTSIQASGLVGGVTTSIITANCTENGSPATSGVVTFASTKGSIVGSAPIVNGTASVEFTSNETGIAQVSAVWEDTAASAIVNVTAGPPYAIEVASNPASIECDGNSFASIIATVKDIAGNNVTDGTVVRFLVEADAAGGGNGTVTPEARTSNGQATALLISRNSANAISKPGTATIYVMVKAADQPAGIPVPVVDIENHKTHVQFTSQDVSEIHLGATSTNIRGWDFVNNTTTIVAVVYDKQHNPVPDGTAVYFTANHGMIYGNAGKAGNVAVSTTTDGRANATLVSDASGDSTWKGFVDVTATCGKVTVNNPGLVIFSGWPSFTTSLAEMFPLKIAPVKDQAVITIIARDINNNPVVDGTSVTIETTKGTISAASTKTVGGVVEVTLKTSDDTANPTEPGPGRVKIRIDSGGHNPETGGGPLPLSIDFTVE